jgi:putative DNA primase/helicase
VELQGLPDKGDVTDWVNHGGTKDKLLRLAAEAPEWQPQADPALLAEKTAKDYRPGDVGNAKRFVDLHGDNLLYCAGSWFSWSGMRWEEDKTLHIYKLASGMQDIVLTEAALEVDEDRRVALGKVGKSLGMKKTIDAMISLSRHHVAVTQDVFDKDPYLLNVQNGTINLRTGELLPHVREDRITKIAGAAYDPEAACPRWLEFLDTIFDGRRDLIRFVQKAIGYALTGDVGEQCFFVLHGTGANGKSTLLDVVQSLFGDYALHSRMETFLTRKNDSIPNDLARLAGARLVTAIEIDKGRRLSESTVKTMTGKDPQTARFLHKEFFTFIPQAKIFLAVNHRPVITGTDHAIWRRVRLVPFLVVIPEDKRNKHLAEEIAAEELAGILTWAIQGCLLWQMEGLEPGKDVKEATELYRADMDPLGPFIRERCVEGPGCSVVYAHFYREYCKWAGEANETPMTKRQFGEVLADRGYGPAYGTEHVAIRKGIGLLSDIPVTR